MSNTAYKNSKSELKFVYSENNALSIIFQNNDILLGIFGEFNNNLKELERITKTKIYSRGNSILVKSDPEKIELYWIPTDTNLYDPTLDIRTVGKYIGIIPPRHPPPRVHLAGSQKFNVQKDHKFVCKNSVGYVRIIEIKNTKEVVKI